MEREKKEVKLVRVGVKPTEWVEKNAAGRGLAKSKTNVEPIV